MILLNFSHEVPYVLLVLVVHFIGSLIPSIFKLVNPVDVTISSFTYFILPNINVFIDIRGIIVTDLTEEVVE